MTTLSLSFTGQIKGEVRSRDSGGKKAVEVSICKKNRKLREADEDSFTWAKISIWSPPDWMTEKLVTGAFIGGTGELTLRSYVDKDGNKKSNMEINCQSFGVEVADTGAPSERAARATASAPAPAPRRPAPAGGMDVDSEPPFQRKGEWE